MQLFFWYRPDSEGYELAEQIDFAKGELLPTDLANRVIVNYGWCMPLLIQGCVFQSPQAIELAQCSRTTHQRLRVNGIPTSCEPLFTSSSEANHIRNEKVYEVFVFHLEMIEVIQCHRIVGVQGKHNRVLSYAKRESVLIHEMSMSLRKIRKLAVRAIYAIGLDYGVVTIRALTNEKFEIEHIEAIPRLSFQRTRLLAHAMNELARNLLIESHNDRHVVLGADPEFLLCNPQGKIVPASRFFQREGKVGCDSLGSPRYRHLLPLAELRPKPSGNAHRLTAHVRQTMQFAARQIADESLMWLSGGMPFKGFPLGGHLHFSNIWLNVLLLRALDNYLALPLLLLEGEHAYLRRPRYGYLGDFRYQSHGGFEYRTLASWLESPMIAKAVFTCAQFIAYHAYELHMRPLLRLENQIAFYQADHAQLLPIVKTIYQDIQTMRTYPSIADEVNPLFERIFAQKRWNEKKDIRLSWNINKSCYSQPLHV